MTDINNNMGADKLKQVQNVNFKGLENNVNVAGKNYADKEIKNLDNAHSALVGRSMIKKSTKTQKTADVNFNGQVAKNIKADLAELNANPELVAKAVAIGDLAMKKGYSYEQASAMAREFMDSYK